MRWKRTVAIAAMTATWCTLAGASALADGDPFEIGSEHERALRLESALDAYVRVPAGHSRAGEATRRQAVLQEALGRRADAAASYTAHAVQVHDREASDSLLRAIELARDADRPGLALRAAAAWQHRFQDDPSGRVVVRAYLLSLTGRKPDGRLRLDCARADLRPSAEGVCEDVALAELEAEAARLKAVDWTYVSASDATVVDDAAAGADRVVALAEAITVRFAASTARLHALFRIG